MRAWVVDTNVLLVASGHHGDISRACVIACVGRIQEIQKRGRVVLDDAHRILDEYGHKGDSKRGKGVGDVFLKWLHRNFSRCLFVAINEHPVRGFVSFPDDPDLARFDPADRKFVAVAAACNEHPPILQAADSKWWDWARALERNGISVEFLCPDDIQRFRVRKGMA